MEEIILEALGFLFNVGMEIAVAFWNELLNWVNETLATWIVTDFGPGLAESVKVAFLILSQVATTLYRAIQQAWNSLRQVLLEMTVEFHQTATSSKHWVRHLTTVLVKVLQSGQPVRIKREVEEVIDWEHLPADVRATWIKTPQKKYKVDVLKTREQELQAISMAH
jgi:hypothetical protein